jgi:hypothetical protein
MRATVVLFAIFGLSLSFSAAAAEGGQHNRYKWKDAEGNLHYDDALPAEAVKFGYDVVNNSGLVLKHVDAPKTPEQLKAEHEAAAKQDAERKATEDQRKHDQQLLAAYPTEQDLARVQQGQLDSIDQEAHATQLSLDSQEKSLAEMLGRAGELERTDKPVPPALRKQIDAQRDIVAKQKTYIAGKQKERAEAAQSFAADLEQYRALRDKAQARP